MKLFVFVVHLYLIYLPFLPIDVYDSSEWTSVWKSTSQNYFWYFLKWPRDYHEASRFPYRPRNHHVTVKPMCLIIIIRARIVPNCKIIAMIICMQSSSLTRMTRRKLGALANPALWAAVLRLKTPKTASESQDFFQDPCSSLQGPAGRW